MDERLRQILERAQALWPGVTLDAQRFAERLAECEGGETPHATDLYLAAACAAGDARALAAFEANFLSKVGSFISRVDRSAPFADEVRQRLRESLLVGKSGRPGIAAFAARGALMSWVHVAALRTALDLRRSEGDVRETPDGDAAWADLHPELNYIQQRYREDFRAAFQAALAGLPAPERRLLRMHFVDGLSLRQIGAIEHLDKSNVSRRLAAIRASVLEGTRAQLRGRLRIDESELDSLLDVMRSQLDISIERILGRTHHSP
jgi:RNA polymerase sigma-70 factor (ECF subfamily)